MSCRFDLYVSYSQLAVFQRGLDEPFNMWTDEQVKEGYSSKPGSVSICSK
ncbi:competence protein ComJ [Pinirhizobacter sp.]